MQFIVKNNVEEERIRKEKNKQLKKERKKERKRVKKGMR